MDMDFMGASPLVRHRMPRIWFLYIGSYVCSTLLSDPASRRRPCASLSLHLHQVVKRTFTFELSNMLGTLAVGISVARYPPHRSPRAGFPHEALILDEWRRSAARDEDGARAVWEPIVRLVGAFGPSWPGVSVPDDAMTIARAESPFPGMSRGCRGSRVPRGS